jgi:hypothetical protein
MFRGKIGVGAEISVSYLFSAGRADIRKIISRKVRHETSFPIDT